MFRNMIRICLLWALAGSFSVGEVIAEERFTIHEWGTFTVLQDERGVGLPGVNVNEEQLPPFVHQLDRGLIRSVSPLSRLDNLRSKGLPISFPAATMRMETPIIYIYPPSTNTREPIDVQVEFRGGWISEWYPNATVRAPGFRPDRHTIGNITPHTVGGIQWRDLTTGTDAPLPETDEHVWLAPRRVTAPRLSTSGGEVENYLFYRGVANRDAPLRVTRDNQGGDLSLWTNPSAGVANIDLAFRAVWLADIRADGALAFRQLKPLAATGAAPVCVLQTRGEFAPGDFAEENLALLRQSMKESIMAAGLFDDEAEAMLETWQLSYFKSPGLRLFFTLPPAWIDHVLPLEVSRPADIERVMIGRIELVSPGQRSQLRRIEAGPTSTMTWFTDHLETLSDLERTQILGALYDGGKSLAACGFDVPPDYQAFLALGRFREAIVLDQLKRKQSLHLAEFVRNYRLEFVDSSTVASAKKVPIRPPSQDDAPTGSKQSETYANDEGRSVGTTP